MKAHKVIEVLKIMATNGLMQSEHSDILTDKIIEAQKFEFDFGEFPVATPDEMRRQLAELHLPYQLCYFEIPGSGAILARDYADSVLIQPFLQYPHGRIAVVPPEFQMVIEKSTGAILCGSSDPNVQKDWGDPNDAGANVVCGLAGLVVRAITVLNCCNVVTVDNPPPISLNKKRAKAGKLPLYSYKTLHIKTDAGEKPIRGAFVNDRVGPRIHMRRGHIRTLPTGVKTWVQSCVVGSMSKGMVMKDYRIT